MRHYLCFGLSLATAALLASGCNRGGGEGSKPMGAPPVGQVAEGVREGQRALEIEGQDADGQRFKLSDYRGKVVLLDFWFEH